MRSYSGFCRVHHSWRLRDMSLPVFRIVLSRIERVRLQHLPVWLLALPQSEAQLVTSNQLQLLPLQRAEDCFTRTLLPDAVCLFISQQSISVVDSRQAKVQQLPFDDSIPHQPCVTQGAIRHSDRDTAYGVVHDVVIAHGSYRISSCFGSHLDRQHLVIRIDQRFSCALERGRIVGVKHLFEDVDMRENRTRGRNQQQACQNGSSSYPCELPRSKGN